MAITDPIDVTPGFTFSTIQFENETFNVLVLSLIAVLILTNIGSIVSKLVYFTRETRFNYNSWLRAFIFANSDDPIRIVTWILRGYVYRNRHDTRRPQKFRCDRLFTPLAARFIVLVCSIASIAITVPGRKTIDDCTSGDFSVKVNVSNAAFSPFDQQRVCIRVPLKSARGIVDTTAAFCNCPISSFGLGLTSSGVAVYIDKGVGRFRTIVFSKDQLHGTATYVEWKRPGATFSTFRSDFESSFKPRDIAEVAVRALTERRPECNVVSTGTVDNDDYIASIVSLDCAFDTEKEINIVSSYVRNALYWARSDTVQPRIKFSGSDKVGSTRDCPLAVTIVRPIVNIVPLIIVLTVWFIINMVVSVAVLRHGNALDAGFHIIKEALGHDSTSNPFEEASHRKEIMRVELKKWICTTPGPCGGHVGFIGRHGDIPVSDFDSGQVIGACNRAAIELDRANALCGQAVPGSPGTSHAFASPETAASSAQPPNGGPGSDGTGAWSANTGGGVNMF